MSDLKSEDLRILSYTSKRKGSWSLDTPKGIHVIHLPTGLEVKEESERSQYLNRAIALEKLEKLIGDL
jgi:protein subunit release factor A